MTKQEIISAIDSTIVPNRKKGITAESLANLLREMASATPEGGSHSSGSDLVKRIWIDEALELEPTEEHLAENIATVEFFKNGGSAVLLCAAAFEGETNTVLCNNAAYFDGLLQASSIYDDNYFESVPNVRGTCVVAHDDGTVQFSIKSQMSLVVYVPDEGKELSDYKRGLNVETYNVIRRRNVASPIMIKWNDATYTSAVVRFGTINEEIGEAAIVGFFIGTTNVMSVVYILSDGTTMEGV